MKHGNDSIKFQVNFGTYIDIEIGQRESWDILVNFFEVYWIVPFSHLVDTGRECVETLQERIDRGEQWCGKKQWQALFFKILANQTF